MSNAVSITVSLKDSSSNPPKLKLKDSEGDHSNDGQLTTKVKKGANITWIPDETSGISSIEIVKKSGECDLLSSSPTPNGNKYIGQVKADPGTCKSEKYSINFKIDGDDSTYTDDPKLDLKH